MVKTITERIFGTIAKIKTIDLLAVGMEFDYTASDIARGAELSRQHAYRIIKELMGYNLICKSRKISGIQAYRWNKQSILGKAVLDFDKELLKYQMQQVKKAK